jgi:alpha-1,2-mannosyltransferase
MDHDPAAAPPRWDRRAPWLVGAVLALMAALQYRRHGADLEVYWRAARRFLAAEPLYRVGDGLRMYRYAPGAALVFAPLAPLSYALARALWYAVLVAVGAGIARSLVRRVGPGSGAVVLAAFCGAVRPLLDELHYAQANLVVLALLLAAFAAEDRGREYLAGALLALAAGLKLAPLLLALDLVVRRRWRALAGLALGAAALALAPALTYGLAGALALDRAWWDSLRTAAIGIVTHGGNQSLLAAARRAGLPGELGTLAGALLAGVALAVRDRERRRALLLLCCVLAAPLGWVWNYVMAIPALLVVARGGPRRAWGVAAFGLASLVPLYDVAGPRVEHWVLEHSLYALAMVALFALTLHAKAAGEPSRS